MTNLKISTPSSYELAAIYTQPENGLGEYPFVLLLHGHTGWKEEEHLSTLAEDLAQAGIASLRFDMPGSGGSSGTWEKDYRVSNYLTAVKEVMDYVVANFSIDSEKVGIWGHSMGGMTAILAAAQKLYDFKAVCGSQPSPGNIARDFRDDPEYWKEYDGVSIKSGHFGTIWLPAAHFIDRMQYKTSEAVKDIQAPLLVISGTDDDLVPATQVKDVYEAANEPKTYIEYPTDHFYKRNPEMLKMINKDTVDFFAKVLK